MDTRTILFGRDTTHPRLTDVGLLALRVFAGAALALAHGWDKLPPAARFVARVGELGFPGPGFFAYLAGIAEYGGGLLLALGLFTRPAAFVVLAHMTIVVTVAHAGDVFIQREKALLFGFIALLYTLAGPGRYSLDALARRGRGG